MQPIVKYLLFLFLPIAEIHSTTANDTSLATQAKNGLVLGAGGGLGILTTEYDANLYYYLGNRFVGVRYLESREARFDVWGSFPRPLERIWQFDALVGAKAFNRDMTASISMGIGLFGGTLRGRPLQNPDPEGYTQYEHLDQTTVAIPMEARMAYTPTEYLELGISGIANINSKHTLLSLFVSFRVLFPFLSFAG